MALLELFSVVLCSLSFAQNGVGNGLASSAFHLLDDYISESFFPCEEFFVRGPVDSPEEASGVYDINADCYEPNDSVSSSTVLCSSSMDCTQEYRMHVDATLHPHNGVFDSDFYAIPLQIDSRVSIMYSSYDTCVFAVYALKYYDSYGSPYYEEILIDELSETSTFSYCLTAGTCFIYLHGTEFVNYYSLDVSVIPKDVGSSNAVLVPEKRFVYGSECIVSLLDYSYSQIPLISYSQTSLPVNNIGNGCNTLRDYSLEKIIESLNGGATPYCSILIWERSFLESINIVFQALMSHLQAQIDSNAHYEFSISVTDWGLSFFDMVVSVVLSLIPAVGPAISIPVSLADSAFHVSFIGLMKNFLLCDTTLVYEDLVRLCGLNGYLSGLLSTVPSDGCLPKPVLFENEIRYDSSTRSLVVSPTQRSGYVYNEEVFDVSYPFGLGHQMLSILEENNEICLRSTDNLLPLMPQINALSSNYAFPSTSIEPGDFLWFSFTAEYSGLYYFVASGPNNLLIEPFNSPVIGYSSSGLLFSPVATVSLYGQNCPCFRLDMTTGQCIYMRVRLSYATLSACSFSMQVIEGQYVSGFACQHDYNFRYSDINSTSHRAYCWCGASILQAHIWDETWYSFNKRYGHCGVCGTIRQFDTGFIKQGAEDAQHE